MEKNLFNNHLIERVRANDREALNELYLQSADFTRQIISKMVYSGVCSNTELEDLTQEIVIKLVDSTKTFDFNRNVKFSTWAYTIASNHVKTFLNRTVRNRLEVIRIDEQSEFVSEQSHTPEGSDRTFKIFMNHLINSGTPWQVISFGLCHTSSSKITPLELVNEFSRETLYALCAKWQTEFEANYKFNSQLIDQLFSKIGQELHRSVQNLLSRNDSVSIARYNQILLKICGNIEFEVFVCAQGIAGASIVSNWNYNVRKRLSVKMAKSITRIM